MVSVFLRSDLSLYLPLVRICALEISDVHN